MAADYSHHTFTEHQLREAVRLKLVSFEDLLLEIQKNNIIDEKHDIKFLMHVERLLRELFVGRKDGRPLGKMQACRLVPALHIDTCKKYIGEAIERGLVEFVDDPKDGRQKNVRLTKRFVAFIEKKAADKLRVAMKIASS